jgi:hypothetical protein
VCIRGVRLAGGVGSRTRGGGGVVWADDGMTVCVGDGVGFLGNRNVYSFGSVAEVRKEVRARPLPDQGIS